MKKLLITLTVFIAALNLTAQSSADALRYSRQDIAGTARFVAMGGSFGALGGEVSGLSINPGGIGVYRSSEFSFSTGFNNYNSTSNYRGVSKEDGRINFNIPNLSYVGNYKGDANGWKYYSFGLTHNRVNTFSGQSRLFGDSKNSTIIDQYVQIMNSDNPSIASLENYEYPGGVSQAWWISMVDQIEDPKDSNSLIFIPRIFNSAELGQGRSIQNIAQERILDERGSQSETQFTFGGNFQDKVYLGGSIGFQNTRYEIAEKFTEDYTYSPVASASDTFLISSYEQESFLDIQGKGVNFKIGVIYKISDNLRAGLAIHSPTIMGYKETFEYDAKSVYADGFEVQADSITTKFEYQIRTPARYIASMAYLLGQNGAINAEYEYLNYSSASFYDKSKYPNDYSPQNDEIDLLLTSAHNVRVGAEYKFNPFVARIGYNYQGNPYDSQLTEVGEGRSTYSIGGGFRNKNFNFDMALNYREMSITEGIYSTVDAPAVIDESETNLVFTFGWRW
ncbi:MAG: outer membrane protein transport protein [Flavobacteriales bacterium]|nr:outer membrane protein transport protein [Flavobacteriales bacterium]